MKFMGDENYADLYADTAMFPGAHNIIARTILLTKLTKDGFDALGANGNPPVDYVLVRPCQRRRCSDAVLIRAGPDTAITAWSATDVNQVVDVGGEISGRVQYSHATVILNWQNLVLLESIYLAGYISGNCATFFEKKEQSKGFYDSHQNLRARADIIVLALPAGEADTLLNPFDLTGSYYNIPNIPSGACMWPGQGFYERICFFSEMQKVNQRTAGLLGNTLVYRGYHGVHTGSQKKHDFTFKGNTGLLGIVKHGVGLNRVYAGEVGISSISGLLAEFPEVQ